MTKYTPNYLNSTEAAQALGIKRNNLYQLVRRKKIKPAYRGLFHPREVERYRKVLFAREVYKALSEQFEEQPK